MAEKTKREQLAESDEMVPVAGTVDVEIPIDKLWQCFRRARLWPRWNPCFHLAKNQDLTVGQKLIWSFHPIRWWMLYRFPAIADIVEVEPGKKVTWEVTALPGFFARHTYHLEDLGNGKTRFGSWEQAMGWSFRLFRRFWISHFTMVKDRSLEGAQFLEAHYRRHGHLELGEQPRRQTVPGWGAALLGMLLLLLLQAGLFGVWFYREYGRQSALDLAPGVHVVLAGGSNSLVVQSGGEALVVDPKFGPGAQELRGWITEHGTAPVGTVVDTHYHYDHLDGNPLYPGAKIYAAPQVAEFARREEPARWQDREGLPTAAVVAETRLTVGDEEVVLHPIPYPAHTHGDVWVHLPKHDLIVTGDLLFHTYYPFLDLNPDRGASLPGQIRQLRAWAAEFPTATFVPGHGPLAKAADVAAYADYLEALWTAVTAARAAGTGPAGARAAIDWRRFDRKILPSFHGGTLHWATSWSNVRDAYRLAASTRSTES